jgi:hypothetical protein
MAAPGRIFASNGVRDVTGTEPGVHRSCNFRTGRDVKKEPKEAERTHKRTFLSRVMLSRWTPPLACLALVALCVVLALPWLRRIEPKDVKLFAECASVSIPAGFDLDLSPAAGLHLRGFEGRLQRIDTLAVSAAGSARQYPVSRTPSLTLKRLANAASSGGPSFMVRPSAVLGPMWLTAQGGAELSVDPSQTGPALSVEPLDPLHAAVHVEAEKMDLEANRLHSDALSGVAALRGQDSVQMQISNPIELAVADFTSPGAGEGDGRSLVTLDYRDGHDSIPVQSAKGDAFGAQLGRAALGLNACSTGTLSFDGRQMPRLAGAPRFSAVIQGSALSVTGIALQRRVEGRDTSWLLQVSASGRATRLAKDGREQLPSQLQELLDEPVERKSLYALAFGLVLMVGAELVKRSLHMIAAQIIRDPKE